jgi:hypothetical protein
MVLHLLKRQNGTLEFGCGAMVTQRGELRDQRRILGWSSRILPAASLMVVAEIKTPAGLGWL